MRVSVPAAASMTVVTYMSVPSPSYFSYSCVFLCLDFPLLFFLARSGVYR